MTALIGYATLFVLVFMLLRGKMSTIVVFGTIPIIGALLLLSSPSDINDWIGTGLGSVWKTAVLFIFSVEYFGLMSDVGMFDVLVAKLVKLAGTNVILVAAATAVVAVIGHLDGATATTVLITIPAMLPLWKRLKMRPTSMLFIIGTAMGVMNLVPWGGPIVRVATVLDMDVTELWHQILPFQGVCLVATMIIAVGVGMWEKRNGAGQLTAEEIEAEEHKELDPEAAALLRPNLLWFNLALTFVLVLALMFGIMSSHVLFMIALAIAMLVNYPDAKMQRARFKAHASDALDTSATLLAAAIFIGIMQNSGMLDAMVDALLAIMPEAMGRYMNIIAGLISVPVGCCLGADTFYYGLFPLLGEAGAAYGVPQLDVGIAMLIGKNVSMICSPLQPTTYLSLGLAGVEMKDHLKANFPRTWVLSIGFCIIAMFMGLMRIY